MKKILLLALAIIVMLTAIESFLLIGANLFDVNASTIPWLERLMAYPLPRRFMMMIGEIGLSVLLFMLYKQQCVSKENEG